MAETAAKSGLIQECPPDLVENEFEQIEAGPSTFNTDSGTKDIKEGDVVDVLSGYAGGGDALDSYRALADHGSTNLGTEDYSVSSNWENLGVTTTYNAVAARTNLPLHSAVSDGASNNPRHHRRSADHL